MKILADAGPIFNGQLTGVGYFTKELLTHLNGVADVTGYSFNFRGKKRVQLPFPIIEQKVLPGKTLTLPRYLGVELPLALFGFVKKPDVIVGTNFLIPPAGNIPTVPVVYDLCFHDHPEWVQGRNGAMLRKMLPRTLKRSSGAIVISDFTKHRLQEIYTYRKPIQVIGIPPKQRTDEPVVPAILRDINKKFYLFVSTIEPRKNLSTLLDAFDLFAKNQPNLMLVVAGKPGWDDRVLERLRKSNDKVVYLDYVSEAERNWLYLNTIATVVPSHYEGFGMMTLESLDAGSPVIVSDIPPHREILGIAGDYFLPTDTKKLAALLSQYNNQPYRDRMLKKQRVVLNNYNWEKTAETVFKFINDVA